MRHPLTRRPRRGFTLVELLVACALTVLIMAVLATAFQTGLATFSHLKSTVGLSEQLRSAESVMRRDLEATHLEDADGVAVRVSALGATPPARGYLEVIQATALVPSSPVPPPGTPYVAEGSEDQVASCRATNHGLFFTTKLKGSSPQEVYLGVPPPSPSPPLFTTDSDLADYATPGASAARWAELGYFLRPTSLFTVSDDQAAAPLALFTLCRSQKVLALTADPVGAKFGFAAPTTTPELWRKAFPEASISTQPDPAALTTPRAFANDPATVTDRRNRSYVLCDPATGAPALTFPFTAAVSGTQGAEVLVTNVVSMQIRVMLGGGTFQDELPGPAPTPGNPRRLDTSSPANPQVRAIQIKLRVYDTKNRLTRQTTMTFDL